MEEIQNKDIPQMLGIKKDDKIFVSSDAKMLLYNAYRLNGVMELDSFINALQDAIGPKGTLVFPTYNWGFCKGEKFDYYKTPCLTGSLGSRALEREDFRRTKHPIYSFAVWGAEQDRFCELNNISSFGDNSPFALFKQECFINIIVDTTLNHCFTYAHYVEEMSANVRYRYMKNFSAPYVDNKNKEEIRTYSMFVRYLDMDVKTELDRIEPFFLKAGCEHILNIGYSTYRILELDKVYPIIMNDIINNESRLLTTFKGQNNA